MNAMSLPQLTRSHAALSWAHDKDFKSFCEWQLEQSRRASRRRHIVRRILELRNPDNPVPPCPLKT